MSATIAEAAGTREALLVSLARLAEAASTAREMRELYRALRQFALANVPCDGLYVTLDDPERHERHVVYAYVAGQEADATLPTLLPDAEQPHSSLAVPIRVLARVVGAFEVQSLQQGVYTEEHASALQVAAQITAIALENNQLRQRERVLRQEAEETGERFRALADLSSDFAYSVRLEADGQLVKEWVTGSVARVVGVTAEGMTLEAGYPINLHPDDRPLFARRVEALRAGDVQVTEYRIVRPSGEVRWLRDVGKPLWDAGQARVVRVVGSAQDITQRKQAELALEQQALELESLYRASAPLLNSALGVERVAHDIAQSATREFALADCGVLLLDEQRTELKRIARAGPYEVLATAPLSLAGSGLTVAAARSGETVYAADVDADPRYAANDRRTRSELAVPLMGPEGVIGVLDLQSPEADAFSERDQRVINAFAKRAGLALANTLLFSQTRQHLAEIEVLNKISSSLRVAKTLGEMLPRLLEATLDVLGTGTGNIALLDEARQELHSVVNRGWFDRLPTLVLKPGEGIAGHVLLTAEPFTTREFATDPRPQIVARDLFPKGWGGACVPIRTSNAVVATMFIMVELPRELSAGELRLLTTVSEIAGNAIHRTRLHEQTEQRLQQIIALHAIDTAITSSLDLQVTLSVLLDQLLSHLHVDAACLLLLQPASTRLEYAAGRGFRTRIIQQVRLPLGEGYAGRIALERVALHLGDLHQADPDGCARRLFAAERFAAYFGVPLVAKGTVKGVLEIFHRAPLTPANDWFDFLEAVAGQAALALDNFELFRDVQMRNAELVHAYDATIEGWSQALDLRDKETEGHTQRVTAAAIELAQMMNLSDAEIVHIRRGALLHDIGKMGIPDRILLKPGPLNDEEWEIMRRHPVYAFNLLSPIEYLRPALDIPYCHHEWWNGGGYPRGLKGEQIPLAARIFAVVDVWDALRSDRPYRPAWPAEKVRAHLLTLASSHLDAQVVALFMQWLDQQPT
jgi:PAS domain S-box-containing protein